MRMVITTGDLEEGAHHVSEELYKKVMLLIMANTHPELSRPTPHAADELCGRCMVSYNPIDATQCHGCGHSL